MRLYYMRYLTNSLLILILLLSVVLTGCYKYKFMETIYIDDIYTQEEDEYLIYFYTDDCYYCKKNKTALAFLQDGAILCFNALVGAVVAVRHRC